MQCCAFSFHLCLASFIQSFVTHMTSFLLCRQMTRSQTEFFRMLDKKIDEVGTITALLPCIYRLYNAVGFISSLHT